jgi:hypothetical protein
LKDAKKNNRIGIMQVYYLLGDLKHLKKTFDTRKYMICNIWVVPDLDGREEFCSRGYP